jgi:hypothetical protein
VLRPSGYAIEMLRSPSHPEKRDSPSNRALTIARLNDADAGRALKVTLGFAACLERSATTSAAASPKKKPVLGITQAAVGLLWGKRYLPFTAKTWRVATSAIRAAMAGRRVVATSRRRR